MKGNHTFKFGVDVRRARFDQILLLRRQRRITPSTTAAPTRSFLATAINMPNSCWASPTPILRAPASAKIFAAPRSIRSCRTVGRLSPTYAELRLALGVQSSSDRHQRVTSKPSVPVRTRQSIRAASRTALPTGRRYLGRAEPHLCQHRARPHRLGGARRSRRACRDDVRPITRLSRPALAWPTVPTSAAVLGEAVRQQRQDQHSRRLGPFLQSDRRIGSGPVRR